MSRAYPIHTVLGARMYELGYTKAEFCRVTGIHDRTMTEYLAGRKAPLDDHVFRMADALECDADDLTD